MKQLIVGDIPPNFDPSQHQILGHWSSFRNQELLFEKKYDIPDTSLTREDYKKLNRVDTYHIN